MSQRFGGKYSPNGASNPNQNPATPSVKTDQISSTHFGNKRPARTGLRSNLLFAVPFLFVWKAFQGGPGDLALGLGASALLLGAAFMTREGLIAQDAYDARRVARKPALPRKIFGAVLSGLGLGLAAIMAQQNLLIAGLLGGIGGALQLAAFGLDPLKDKGVEGIDLHQTDRVARAIDEAEGFLRAMHEAILRLRDRQLEARVNRFTETARGLFRTVENDPRDLTAARKYLGVYLQGARDATVKFVALYGQERKPELRSDYEALLTELETTFAARTTALLSNDHTDLNIEIEVLRERLEFENR